MKGIVGTEEIYGERVKKGCLLNNTRMPQEIGLWEIREGRLEKVQRSVISLEEELEDLLEQDVSIIGDDLLVIGRQVETGFGKLIDLLCLDGDGNLIVVELKKDEAPRETMAQALEYASWIDDLSYDEIEEIANDYFKSKNTTLEEAFKTKFGKELPDTLNESHKILIVASDLDDQSERVIRYLSQYGIKINAVKLNYFKLGEHQLVGRVLFIPETIGEETRGSKRSGRIQWTEERFFKVLEEKNKPEIVNLVRELYRWILSTADRVRFGTGKETGSITFHYLKEEETISVFTIYTNGKLMLNYGWMRNQLPTEVLKEFHEMIVKIPTLSHIPADFSKWHTLGVDSLLDRDNLDKFKNAVLWLGRKIKT